MSLKPQQRRFLEFLKNRRPGDIVSRTDILSATGWADSSFETYLSKQHLAAFLFEKNGRFIVLQNGDEVTDDAVKAAFTQVKRRIFQPFKGWELTGEHETYRLEERKGNGAVAQVWRCSVMGKSDQVAVKIASPRDDLLKELDNVLRRFSRESRHLALLSHPNIISYRDMGRLDEHPFLVMDLADRSVADILKTGEVSLEKSIEIIRAALNGLAYLHARGHIHRDVKPANILQCGSRFVLGDLGIVRWSDMHQEFVSAGTITTAAVKLGSWYYMSPEQQDNAHEVTTATDVYSLGITWYELLTKTTPQPARIASRKFSAATSNSVVDDMIRKMVEFDAEDRPTVATLLEGIDLIS